VILGFDVNGMKYFIPFGVAIFAQHGIFEINPGYCVHQ
jgi:hypothetical protein